MRTLRPATLPRSVENVTGSAFNDTLIGDGLANVLSGGAGNDTLTGGAGADVFKYSFTLAQGQGETFRFTDFLSQKFGRDFGDQLPDAPVRHHHHDHDDDHDDHHHHHGHGDDDGHHAQGGGLTEKFFETNYKEWLKEVVVPDLLAQGFVLDANGNGKIKIDINEDDPNGTPRIEGLTQEQLDAIFGDRDDVILRDGHETEKAFYSNSYTSPGGGQTTVTSGDGNDIISDFANSDDILRFDFTADVGWNTGMTVTEELAFLQSFFAVTPVDTDSNVGNESTKIAVGTWSTTLQGQLYGDADADGFSDVFNHVDIYVNDVLIG